MSNNNYEELMLPILRVSEVFYSIQGEGPTLGKPSVFIRLAGCNLECVWCDTKFTWLFSKKRLEKLKQRVGNKYLEQIGNKYYNFREETKVVDIQELLAFIYSVPAKNVVITGGEPLLQKIRLKMLLEPLLKEGYWIEIETNGTIMPYHKNINVRYNVSPKLSSSMNPLEKRFKPEVLRELINRNSIFKFVIQNESDFLEMLNLVNSVGIPKENIYLMAEGDEPEQLKKNALWVIEKCKITGFNYSHRLHVELFEGKRGM